MQVVGETQGTSTTLFGLVQGQDCPRTAAAAAQADEAAAEATPWWPHPHNESHREKAGTIYDLKRGGLKGDATFGFTTGSGPGVAVPWSALGRP